MWLSGELFEISSWLPPKDLLRLSTVCPAFRHLLSEDTFIKKQCKNMQLVGDTYFFLDHVHNFSRKLELHTITSNNSSEKRTNLLPPGSLDFVLDKGSILASSNGLLCCKNMNSEEDLLFLLNPMTRSYLPIPTPDETIDSDKGINLVFSCDDGEEESGGYLLMAVIHGEWGEPFRSKIYSPEESTWWEGGEIHSGARNLCLQYSVKHNGVVYMISDTGYYITRDSPFHWPYIVAYDIHTSGSEFFKVPKDAWEEAGYECPDLRIFKWGANSDTSLNSICLVKLFKNVFTIWVLNITSAEETNSYSYNWTQIFNSPIETMGLSVPLDNVTVTGFTVLNKGLLLFAIDKKIYSCNILDSSDVERVEQVYEHGFGDNFVNFRPFLGTIRRCGPFAIPLP